MTKLADGTVHRLPADFRKAIGSNVAAMGVHRNRFSDGSEPRHDDACTRENAMNASSNHIRRLGLVLIAPLLLLATPLAMAGNIGFSIGLFGPGYGIGYSGCTYCRGNGFVSAYVNSGWGWPGYGGGWGGGYYAGYYPAPVYYYQPAPVYYQRVYREPVVERIYTTRYYSVDDGWRGRAWRGDGHGGYWRDRDGRDYRGESRGGRDHGYWRDRGRRDEGRGGGDRRGGDHGYWRDRDGGGN